ncbi:MAG: hypothetical protein A2927_02445 [Candidatus Komeilibacteria bacterium RIFCSPLOWO2_01_FULL_45_10]|uniref:Uncharacterized protein n=1 Tax=Candidatus Komeilibacteria bacterium RIFCSPLOWO2_01_FULL_45_10 TaxID=1798550 RepID=A0A1G2BIV1_9BACT|nr:MAG: hypothetical protein A2927_02445 [Candidatus Komeilibacteria bacterium RIFCSPLOWO2_01_FULL_45_10]
MITLETIGSPQDQPAEYVPKTEKEKHPFQHRAEQLWRLIKSGAEENDLGEAGEISLRSIPISAWVIIDRIWPFIDKSDPAFKLPATEKEASRLGADFKEVRRIVSEEVGETENEAVRLVNAFFSNKLLSLPGKVSKREKPL